MAELLLLPVSENKWPQYCRDATSGFDCYPYSSSSASHFCVNLINKVGENGCRVLPSVDYVNNVIIYDQ